MSDANESEFKVFVGGLSLETTSEGMKDFFSTFGELSDTIVMRDGATKKSRGFGFVTFVTKEGFDSCLEEKRRMIDGKEVELKMAVPKGQAASQPKTRFKKVFLGGLSPDTSKEDIVECIRNANIFPEGTKFDARIMTEKDSGKPRGFGFITCEPPDNESDECIFEGMQKLAEKKFIQILERSVEIKPAVPRENMPSSNISGGSRNQMRPPNDYSFSDFNPYTARSYDAMRQQYSEYYARAMSGGYSGYDRGASAYYPDPAYSGYYGMGYQQTSSNYGPTRGYGGTDSRRDHRGSYHPYERH